MEEKCGPALGEACPPAWRHRPVQPYLQAVVRAVAATTALHAPTVTAFYTQDLWSVHVPPAWQAFLLAMPYEQLLRLPRERAAGMLSAAMLPDMPTLPDDLLDLVRDIDALVLHRACTVPLQPLAGPDRKTTAELNRRLSPKKLHECAQLATLVSTMACGRAIVDMGCGLGHFAHILHQQHALSVLGIDGNSALTTAGMQRGGRFPPVPAATCRLVTHYVQSWGDIVQTCTQAGVRGAVLTGLHSCGDLTTHMLQAAVQAPDILAGLAVASCCYHKITDANFPVSLSFRKALGPGIVGRASFRAACLSPELWNTDAMHLFRKHHYRALFQLVLERWYGDVPAEVGRVAATQTHCFRTYVAAALRKMGLSPVGSGDDTPTSADLDSIETKYEPYFSRVCVYWTLRCLCGPLLETLILLDRWQFLREAGGYPHMVAAFDVSLSPRNVVIVWDANPAAAARKTADSEDDLPVNGASEAAITPFSIISSSQ